MSDSRSGGSAARAERGHVFLIAAPSGTGKTTICRRILAADERLTLSISHTTRSPRAGEEDGVDYHFVDRKTFRVLVDRDSFLEHAEYGGNLYGTSFQSIDTPRSAGRDVVLEIEVQGARQVRERMPDACLIFLLPPDLATLEARLKGRGTDDESVIEHRMALVDNELKAVELFDYAVVNDDLDRAVEKVLDVIDGVREGRSEEIRRAHDREAVFERWQSGQLTGEG